MEWMKYADEIRELLGLEGAPVAITYSMDAAPDALKGKHRVCDAFVKARDGAVDRSHGLDVGVRGRDVVPRAGGASEARQGCGQIPQGLPRERREASTARSRRSIARRHWGRRLLSAWRPRHHGPAREARLRPDIILFICNAEQASRLVQLDMYDTGVPPRIEMSGATCHQAIGYPVSTGELNVSVMDYTSRRIKRYKPSDLIVSIPYHRFLGIMRSIDRCTAGRAPFEVPESMRRRMDLARPCAISKAETPLARAGARKRSDGT